LYRLEEVLKTVSKVTTGLAPLLTVDGVAKMIAAMDTAMNVTGRLNTLDTSSGKTNNSPFGKNINYKYKIYLTFK